METPKPAAAKLPARTPAAPQPPASNPLFPFRRWSEIAALCLVAAVLAAAAYKYGLPVVHRWLEPSKSASPNPHPSDEPPGSQKPPAGHTAEPQEPGQQAPGPGGSLPGQPGQGVVTVRTTQRRRASAGDLQRSPRLRLRRKPSSEARVSTLRWEVIGDNPYRLAASGIGSVPATGTWQVSPEATQQYTLTAINSGESDPQTKSILIVVVPYPSYPPGPNQTQLSHDGRDPKAIELLAAAQNAMGGKRNLEALHGWQRTERVTWEINRGSTFETTTFIAPVRYSDSIVRQRPNHRSEQRRCGLDVVFGSPVPKSSAGGQRQQACRFASYRVSCISDDDPARTITLAGPSTLLITDKHNDRVYLKLDPGDAPAASHYVDESRWIGTRGNVFDVAPERGSFVVGPQSPVEKSSGLCNCRCHQPSGPLACYWTVKLIVPIVALIEPDETAQSGQPRVMPEKNKNLLRLGTLLVS
ncbi:MAG: hypothetical protein WDM87_06240 [Terracidiphilus sp.]